MTPRTTTDGTHALSADDKSSPAQADPYSPPPSHAWKSPAAAILFIAVAAAGLAGDLWTKHAVFADLLTDADLPRRVASVRQALADQNGQDPGARDVLHALQLGQPLALGVRVRLSTNPGVVFGLPMPRWLVQVATVATVLLVGGFFAASRPRDRWLHIAAGLILAGALGNLYDRLFAAVSLPGIDPIRCEVRDFLDFGAWGYPWVFNVADAWLVVGVAMVFIHWLRSVPSQLASPGKHGNPHV